MKYIPLNVSINKASKYDDENTLVYDVKNCYSLNKKRVTKELLYYYPDLKILNIKVIRNGYKLTGQKVSPKTKIVVKVKNKKVTE